MYNRLHIALIETSGIHKKRGRQAFQKLDLSEGQPKVLVHLLVAEGCLQKDLAEQCHVEPATMTVLLRNMVDRGLILKKTVRVSGGKRAYAIHLTAHGRDLAHRTVEIVDALETDAYKGFSPLETSTLLQLLQRITDNLQE